jgi:uncharacterized membrane protein
MGRLSFDANRLLFIQFVSFLFELIRRRNCHWKFIPQWQYKGMARVLFGRQWFLSLFLSFSPLFIVVVVTLLEEAEYSRRVTAPGGSGERRMGAFLRRPLKQATDLIIQSARVSYSGWEKK